jgi:hypothetical protein
MRPVALVLVALLLVPVTALAQERSIATVGATEVTSQDIGYRTAVERAYGNDAVPPAAALVSLINEALEREAASAVGVAPTAADLAALSRHADETTKAPDLLARVKAIFGTDRASYERTYLAPKVVNSKLRAYFDGSRELHQAERAKAEEALALVKSGKTLVEAAAATGLTTRAFELPGEGQAPPAAVAGLLPKGLPSGNAQLLAIVSALQPGQVHDQVVEDAGGFSIVRLIALDGGTYRGETCGISKRRYDSWFRGVAAARVPRILDAALLAGVQRDYGQVWWVKSLGK